MARTATPAPISKEVAVNEAAIANDFNAVDQLATITQGYSEDRDLMNQLLGQAQMADSFAKFSQTVWSSKLAFVKENKLYQQLKGKPTPNGLEFGGTWKEFCDLLGVSDEKANQDIANLKAFGEEALESMSRMGIGYREMRQYRKLPEDQKLALLEVAKTGDRDSFLDLAEEIIARHAKEKEALTHALEEGKQEHAATTKRLGVVTEQKDKAEAKAARIAVMPASEAAAALRDEATKYLWETQGMVQGRLRAALAALNNAPDEEGKAHFMAGMVGQLMADLIKLRDEFNLADVVGDGRPEWMQWADREDARKAAEQAAAAEEA